jgi:FAD/FMN-containing dehydrogenase
MSTTTSPPVLPVGGPDLDSLAARVTGVVLVPGQPGYDDERAPFNLAVQHHPAVVVGAATTADVQAAVRFAGEQGLPVAVLATGHQAAVPADGAVLVTTRRMSTVAIDPAARTATVGAGVQWQQVVDAAAVHGLAPLAGSSPLVGVVGYTLGGGLSATMGRAYGWAADALRRIEVVTPDGEVHDLGPDSTGLDGELFWALPGAKSNLGVVTSMTFDLFPVARLYAGGLFFAGTDAEAVLRAYAELTAAAPDELSSSIALLRLPPAPFVPEFLRGTFVLHVRVSWLGTAAAGDALLAPLRAAATALVDTVADIPYTDFAGIHADPSTPAPFVERSGLLGPLTPAAVDVLVRAAGAGSDCPVQILQLRHLGGALSRGRVEANAAARRGATFVLDALTIGTPESAAPAVAWTDRLLHELTPWTVGGKNVNFLGPSDTDAESVAEAFDPQTFARLRRLKAALDPANTFRVNHNIVPAQEAENL